MLSWHVIISCNMSTSEISRTPGQNLVSQFAERYSYDSAWVVPPSGGEKGVAKENVGFSKRGIYMVDELDSVLSGRPMPATPEELLERRPCSAKVEVDPEADIDTCNRPSSTLILGNGRWQDKTIFWGACSPKHTVAVIDDEASFYYREDWDFMNAPVFGVKTPGQAPTPELQAAI